MPLGDTCSSWRPEGLWQPLYHLVEADRGRYQLFLARAERAVAWRDMSSYAPVGDEPANAALREALVAWWARKDGELWLLVERIWSGWPDPLMYSLHVRHPGEPLLTAYGEFDDLPPAWSFPAQP